MNNPRHSNRTGIRAASIQAARIDFPTASRFAMQYRVAYEHSLQSAPDDFVVQVPSQLVDDVPANIPRALLPEYITDMILNRSSQIAKIRNLRVL